jgi:hypothetical protein
MVLPPDSAVRDTVGIRGAEPQIAGDGWGHIGQCVAGFTVQCAFGSMGAQGGDQGQHVGSFQVVAGALAPNGLCSDFRGVLGIDPKVQSLAARQAGDFIPHLAILRALGGICEIGSHQVFHHSPHLMRWLARMAFPFRMDQIWQLKGLEQPTSRACRYAFRA